MDKQTILELNVAGLRAELTKLGLNTQGIKANLRERLLEYYGLESSDNTVDTDDCVSAVGSDMGDAAEARAIVNREACIRLKMLIVCHRLVERIHLTLISGLPSSRRWPKL